MSESLEFLKELLKERESTPSYVFDIDKLRSYVKEITSFLPAHVEICYAMKANPFLTASMDSLVKSFEVCSPGEFRICERLGIPMDKIVLSGVYKNEEDMRHVLSSYGGRGIYTIESREQLRILSEISEELGLKIRVLLRVSSGNQFGLDKEEILELIGNREKFSSVKMTGLQFYSGTQKKKLSQMEEELHMLDALAEELLEQSGWEMETLEYGPGFFVPYFRKDPLVPEKKLLEDFGGILKELRFQGRVVLEMGRFLAAGCGYFVTSIVDQKNNYGQKYALVDGGIHHLNYYGQTMAMKQPYCRHFRENGQEVLAGQEEAWNLCGSLCTVSDVIVKQFPLKDAQIHDILVFENVGAYSVTEGIYLFLSRPLPWIYFWSQEQGLRLIRKNLHTDLLNSER